MVEYKEVERIVDGHRFLQEREWKNTSSRFFVFLKPKLRSKAFRDIELLQNLGNELKELYVKSLKGNKNKGLYELRIKFSNDIARIFYFTYCDNKYILLHGFIKKSMKTPTKEIDKARKYMEDYKRRSGYE